MAETVLQVENLQVEFKTRNGIARVLNDVAFSLEQGKTLGIVGESGCGKSMTALSIMGLVPTPPGRRSDSPSAGDLTSIPEGFEQPLRDFLSYCRIECGFSRATLQAYASDLIDLVRATGALRRDCI